MDMTSRKVIVSQRLPVVSGGPGKGLVRTAGGLSSSMAGIHDPAKSVWIGYPGVIEGDSDGTQELLLQQGYVPVEISPLEMADYYDGVSNGILWPLFHYLIHQLPFNTAGWRTYRAVNARFAEEVLKHYRPGDQIWVHDYHLMLVPGILRESLPEAQIGFFLHIPFPSSEIFRVLPWRDEVLRGMLGADLIGFHTLSYLRHFCSSLVRILGMEPQVDCVQHEERVVHLGAFPITIDVQAFAERARRPAVVEAASRLRAQQAESFLALGVDRLDYTKGIPRRLLAIERFFDTYPSYRGRLRFLQIAVPTRETAKSYAEFRSMVNELVGRINSKHGTVDSAPVHLLYRSVDPEELSALFVAANVMLVTPLRDGMNLVAKEFIASRVDGDGVLILSEFAGAAAQLGEAIVVNPYDIDGVAEAIFTSLEMDEAQRRARMGLLAARVAQTNARGWADSFLGALARVAHPGGSQRYDSAESIVQMLSLTGARRPLLFLDYDGTVVPLAARPGLAMPDAQLLPLLRALTRKHPGRVWIVSGRHRQDLEAWIPDAEIGLVAEHGLHVREAGTWVQTQDVDLTWKEKLRPIMAAVAERTPGSQIEEKGAAIVWHYRLADPEFGRVQAQELRLHLLESFSNMPVQIVDGKKCVEARAQGVNKGIAARAITDRIGCDLIIAAGDDRTDEDLFGSMPSAVTIKIGQGATSAKFRLRNPDALRSVLQTMVSEHPPL